jgi:hypothetical protein
MSEKQQRDMIAAASAVCEKRFAREGALSPIWHLVTADGGNIITATPNLSKDEASIVLRALFELRQVVRYLFVDEAWTIDQPVDDAVLARITREGVAAQPGRIEIVMFSGEDRECGQLLARRRIIRPAKGKPYLGPLKYTDVRGETSGRFVGMLPAPRGAKQ